MVQDEPRPWMTFFSYCTPLNGAGCERTHIPWGAILSHPSDIMFALLCLYHKHSEGKEATEGYLRVRKHKHKYNTNANTNANANANQCRKGKCFWSKVGCFCSCEHVSFSPSLFLSLSLCLSVCSTAETMQPIQATRPPVTALYPSLSEQLMLQ